MVSRRSLTRMVFESVSSSRAKNFAAPTSSAWATQVVFEKRQNLGLVWIDALPIAPQADVDPVGGRVFEQHARGDGFLSRQLHHQQRIAGSAAY